MIRVLQSHLIELHVTAVNRCRVECRACGPLTEAATLDGGERVIGRHRRRFVLGAGLWPEWMRG